MRPFRIFKLARDACGYNLQVHLPSARLQCQFLYENFISGCGWSLALAPMAATLLGILKAFHLF